MGRVGGLGARRRGLPGRSAAAPRRGRTPRTSPAADRADTPSRPSRTPLRSHTHAAERTENASPREREWGAPGGCRTWGDPNKSDTCAANPGWNGVRDASGSPSRVRSHTASAEGARTWERSLSESSSRNAQEEEVTMRWVVRLRRVLRRGRARAQCGCWYASSGGLRHAAPEGAWAAERWQSKSCGCVVVVGGGAHENR